MTAERNQYEPPRLTEYGDFERITKGRGSLGSDVGTFGQNQGRGKGDEQRENRNDGGGGWWGN